MLQDLRWALRWIARRPGLASVSVASLGLGIGANVAVFSVIDALLFRPFPVLEPERLGVVMSRTAEGELRHVSAPDYFDFVESSSDRPEAAEHSRSKTRNQRRIDFLRSTGLSARRCQHLGVGSVLNAST